MNIKRQHLPLGLGFVLGSVLLSGTLPAQAQTGNQSDVSGANITTSNIAGGSFAPQVAGGTVTQFATPSAAVNVNNAAGSVSSQLAQGTLPVVATGVPTTSISATVQQTLQSLLTRTGNVAAASQQIQNALINAPGTTNTTLARNLASSLQGLTAGGKVSPTRLAAAVQAYNAVINASSSGFLTNPPPQLLAVQSALSTLVNASLRGR